MSEIKVIEKAGRLMSVEQIAKKMGIGKTAASNRVKDNCFLYSKKFLIGSHNTNFWGVKGEIMKDPIIPKVKIGPEIVRIRAERKAERDILKKTPKKITSGDFEIRKLTRKKSYWKPKPKNIPYDLEKYKICKNGLCEPFMYNGMIYYRTKSQANKYLVTIRNIYKEDCFRIVKKDEN